MNSSNKNDREKKPLRVAIIGLGSMANTVIDALAQLANDERSYIVVGALVRQKKCLQQSSPSLPLFSSTAQLLAAKPDVVVECASHSAVAKYAEDILRGGVNLILASVGALANDALYQQLKQAADDGNSCVYLPAGAIGGLDALSAAKISGLQRVRYTGRKPLSAWQGTPAEQQYALNELTTAQQIFTGSAREVASLYPKNSNVAATVALAGIGMDNTEVELIADPQATENCHEIEVFANSGSFKISLTGKSLSSNVKTSALAAYSMAKSVMNLNKAIVV